MTGIMFSIARSRWTIPTQLLFLTLNGCGLFFGIFYNVHTPDLYPNNAHHKLGWVITWVVIAQLALSLLFVFSGRSREERDQAAAAETAAFLPVSVEAMVQDGQFDNVGEYKDHRWSGDSGHGTERASSSSHSRTSSSGSSLQHQEYQPWQKPETENEDEREEEEEDADADADERDAPQPWHLRPSTFIHQYLNRRVHALFSQRALKVLEVIYDAADRILLVLAFVALVTGAVTYAGLFVSPLSLGWPSR